MEQRVIAYVDGFNLYFGLRSMGLQRCYWLDVPKLVTRYLAPDQRLVATKYFTSRVPAPPDKVRRQAEYLDALSTLSGVTIQFGKYQTTNKTCRACGAVWSVNNEKMTDVNIAVEMMKDAFTDSFDLAIVLSADSDLSSPITAVRTLWPSKTIWAMFPPNRASVDLRSRVHACRNIKRPALESSQLPDRIIGLDGYPRVRPKEWT